MASNLTQQLRNQPLAVNSPSSASKKVAQVESRYGLEFEELEQIGSGGFGRIFQCRHRLDGQHYAIKKVTSFDGNTNEVIVHAQLTHPNIVRYYGSWVEDGQLSECHVDELQNFTLAELDVDEDDEPDVKHRLTEGIMFSPSGTEEEVSLSPPSVDDASLLSKSAPTRDWSKSHKKLRQRKRVQTCINYSFDAENPLYQSAPPSKLASRKASVAASVVLQKTLYIQMELINEARTLRQYLTDRNALLYVSTSVVESRQLSQAEFKESIQLFRQLLSAVSYIHSKGFIHGDLSPENVLLSQTSQLYLTDFGHSRPYNGSQNSSNFPKYTRTGAFSYAPPENEISQAGDIYALGIILLELINLFKTRMERALLITQLKNQGLQNVFLQNIGGHLQKLLSSMLDLQPSQRPSALQVEDQIKSLLNEKSEQQSLPTPEKEEQKGVFPGFEQEQSHDSLQAELYKLRLQLAQKEEQIKEFANGHNHVHAIGSFGTPPRRRSRGSFSLLGGSPFANYHQSSTVHVMSTTVTSQSAKEIFQQ